MLLAAAMLIAHSLEDCIVKLSIGPSSVTVLVHKNVLTKSSAFFQREAKRELTGMKDEQETIILPDEDPHIVKGYIHWLYSGKFPMPAVDKGAPHFRRLSYAYIFGDRRMDPKFKNAIIDAFVATAAEFCSYPSATTMAIVYEETPEGCPARQLLADFIAYRAKNTPDWNTEMGRYDKAMLVDIARAMIRVRPQVDFLPAQMLNQAYYEKEN